MQGVPGIWAVVVGLVDIVENMDTFEGYCVRVLKTITGTLYIGHVPVMKKKMASDGSILCTAGV